MTLFCILELLQGLTCRLQSDEVTTATLNKIRSRVEGLNEAEEVFFFFFLLKEHCSGSYCGGGQ